MQPKYTFTDFTISKIPVLFRNIKRAESCWNWTSSKTLDGYGHYGYKTKEGKYQNVRPHRLFYYLYRGVIPKGLMLDHLCRNIQCVNPDHLEPVTNAVNQQRGKATKLTIQKVRNMRQMAQEGSTTRQVALKFDVDKTTAWRIISYKTWRNI